MKRTILYSSSAIILSFVIANQSSWAQSPANGDASSASDQSAGSTFERALDDIVVTGRKRDTAERAQDVPIAVSAYSAGALEAAHVKDLTDIANLAPSTRLTPTSVPGYGTFFIRGAGVIGSIPSNDPAIGTFIDGMPLGISTGSLTELFDLASIEVLRGPQGTLFGRNVTGGAILLTTKRPNGDFHADLRAGAGSAGQWELGGSVEGGTDNGALAVKLAVQTKHSDGFFHDLQSGSRVGERDVYVVRPTVVLKPSESLTVAVIGEIGKESGDGPVAQNLFTPSTTVTRQGFVPPAGKFDLRLNTHGFNDLRWKHAIVNADWDVGAGTITSITGYRKLDQEFQYDTDGSSIQGLLYDSETHQHQFFQELRFAGKPFGTDAIFITAGASALDQTFSYEDARSIFAGVVRQALKGSIDHQQYGIFAQADISLPWNFTLTAGARYSYEKKAATISSLNNCNYTRTVCTVDFRDKDNWSNFGPKLGLQWKPSQDIMAYASWTRGFRSGGYNVRNTLPASPGPYNEETVDAYEIGVKSDFLDRRLRVNLSGYINISDDLQQTVLDPRSLVGTQTILNAASANTKGFEAELIVIPFEGLVLTGAAGYVHAKYTSFVGLDLTGDGVPDPALAKQLKFSLVPKWTTSASATYETQLGNIGKLTLRGSYSWVDKAAAVVTNDFFLDSYSLIDASASLAINDNVSFTVYGKNLGNSHYANFAATSSLFRTIFPSPGRSWLAQVSFKY